MLLNSGVPMHEALECLMRVQNDNLTLWVIPDLCKRVMNGHRLSTCVAHFPRVFSPTYIALIRASEETGKLVKVLDQLAEWLERREKIERHVRKALTYPIFVMVIAVILTLGLFRTVIPGILETVVGLGVDLPLPTRILMTIVSLIEQPLAWLLALAVLIAVAVYIRTAEGWERFLIAMSHFPVVGPILQYSTSSRYANTMSMLMDSGVDIIRSAKIAANASANPLLERDAIRVAKALREGRYYSEVLAESHLYPALFIYMVKVGDESGKLATLVKRCGDMMEEDTIHKVDVFLNLLEPFVLSAISIGVGFIVVAVLLPMSTLVSAL